MRLLDTAAAGTTKLGRESNGGAPPPPGPPPPRQFSARDVVRLSSGAANGGRKVTRSLPPADRKGAKVDPRSPASTAKSATARHATSASRREARPPASEGGAPRAAAARSADDAPRRELDLSRTHELAQSLLSTEPGDSEANLAVLRGKAAEAERAHGDAARLTELAQHRQAEAERAQATLVLSAEVVLARARADAERARADAASARDAHESIASANASLEKRNAELEEALDEERGALALRNAELERSLEEARVALARLPPSGATPVSPPSSGRRTSSRRVASPHAEPSGSATSSRSQPVFIGSSLFACLGCEPIRLDTCGLGANEELDDDDDLDFDAADVRDANQRANQQSQSSPEPRGFGALDG